MMTMDASTRLTFFLPALLTLFFSIPVFSAIPGDLDHDCDVDVGDYQIFRSTLGKCSGQTGFNQEADYDGDGCISYADYRQWYIYYKQFVYSDADKDGVADRVDQCPDTTACAEVDANGCPISTVGVLLSGSPDQPALDATTNYVESDPLTDADIGVDADGVEWSLTHIEIGFKLDATVQEVNSLIDSIGGRIIGMLEGVGIVLVKIPNPGSVDALDGIIQQLEANSIVRFATKTHLVSLSTLPGNHESLDYLDRIDHHLAVRAQAAWNARDFLESGNTSPPVLVVTDKFGVQDSLSGDFNINIMNPEELASGTTPDFHGYHVLGIIAGSFGGDTSERGLITGMYPGSQPLDTWLVDLILASQANRSDIALLEFGIIYSVLEEVRWSRISLPNIVVNTSISSRCDTPENVQRLCSDNEYTRRAALSWIEKVRGSGHLTEPGRNVETLFLHVVAAGNVLVQGDTDARFASPFTAATLLTDLQDANGNPVPPLINTLVVENAINSSTSPYKPVCLNGTSKRGGNTSAIGTRVWSFSGPQTGVAQASGTSQAAPQVTGLAAYIWVLDPSLSTTDVKNILTSTARFITPDPQVDPSCSQDTPAPVIDAYLGVLAVDRDFDHAPVRMEILDVANSLGAYGGNGSFDEKDVEFFLAQIEAGPSDDYKDSRYDLNGDGRVGGDGKERFDLDMDKLIESQVIQTIGGKEVTFNENAVTDLQVLCYYAYSPLYTGDVQRRAELLPRSKCEEGKIAFIADDGMYVMNPDGSDRKYLGPAGGSWSPDGKKYAYISGGDIFVIDRDGSNLERLTENGLIYDLKWSPDGTKIAFSSRPWRSYYIYVISSDGSYLDQVYNGWTYSHSQFGLWIGGLYEWLPNGLLLFLKTDFIILGSRVEDCYVMNGHLHGNSYSIQRNAIIQNLYTFNPSNLKMVQMTSFSPSSDVVHDFEIVNLFGGIRSRPPRTLRGEEIVFMYRWGFEDYRCDGVNLVTSPESRYPTVTDAYMVDRDGSNLIRLNYMGSYIYRIFWSPDGKKILYQCGSDICVMDANGTNLMNLTLNAPYNQNGTPTWSPDSTKIAFFCDEDICVMNSDGTNLMNLTIDSPYNRSGTPTWSPDGTKIAFFCDGDICVMDSDGTNLINITNTGDRWENSPLWLP